MKVRILSSSVAFVIVLFSASGRIQADTRIVVDFGPHPSAEIAGHGEDQVNWLDADKSDDTICTNCFAALELQRYLRKMTGKPSDFALVDDDIVPEGDLLLIGSAASNKLSRPSSSPAPGNSTKRNSTLRPPRTWPTCSARTRPRSVYATPPTTPTRWSRRVRRAI